jgi:hypothetical protein
VARMGLPPPAEPDRRAFSNYGDRLRSGPVGEAHPSLPVPTIHITCSEAARSWWLTVSGYSSMYCWQASAVPSQVVQHIQCFGRLGSVMSKTTVRRFLPR